MSGDEQILLLQGTKDEHFGKPWKSSDVVLIVEDKKLHAHSIILSFNSPVFEEMLTSACGSPKVIELKDKEYKDIDFLLTKLYPQYESEEGKSFLDIYSTNYQNSTKWGCPFLSSHKA